MYRKQNILSRMPVLLGAFFFILYAAPAQGEDDRLKASEHVVTEQKLEYTAPAQGAAPVGGADSHITSGAIGAGSQLEQELMFFKGKYVPPCTEEPSCNYPFYLSSKECAAREFTNCYTCSLYPDHRKKATCKDGFNDVLDPTLFVDGVTWDGQDFRCTNKCIKTTCNTVLKDCYSNCKGCVPKCPQAFKDCAAGCPPPPSFPDPCPQGFVLEHFKSDEGKILPRQYRCKYLNAPTSVCNQCESEAILWSSATGDTYCAGKPK